MRFSALQLLTVVALNTLIAGFLLSIGVAHGFANTFVASQCVGLSIYATWMVTMRWLTMPRTRRIGMIVAVPVGAALGVALSWLAVGTQSPNWNLSIAGQSLLIGLIFGAGITAVFTLRERMVKLQAELRLQQMRELEIDKQRIEAQLKMLQAQIEPHFLFNTLANVGSLIEADPPQARALLEHLIRYLRATLSRIRAERACLADEVSLLTAYLDVLRIRMGGRLSYAFEVPAALLSRHFPAMLLQPLVENAVRHGIESKLGDGRVEIVAADDEKGWHIEVRDDGVGLSATPGKGVGLVNVRERLRALYGDKAALAIVENPAGGVISRLELPLTGE